MTASEKSNLCDAVLIKLFETPVIMYEWPDGKELADRLKELVVQKNGCN